jgi:hypothetical protein
MKTDFIFKINKKYPIQGIGYSNPFFIFIEIFQYPAI